MKYRGQALILIKSKTLTNARLQSLLNGSLTIRGLKESHEVTTVYKPCK